MKNKRGKHFSSARGDIFKTSICCDPTATSGRMGKIVNIGIENGVDISKCLKYPGREFNMHIQSKLL